MLQGLRSNQVVHQPVQPGSPGAGPVILQSNPMTPVVTTPQTVAPQPATERVGGPIQNAPDAMQGRFATIEAVRLEERDGNRTREFVGEGNSFLHVPGCLEVEAIRIGNMPLPLTEDRIYPHSAGGAMGLATEPLVAFQTTTDGTPVLVRSIISNDGIWPKGARIFVTGKWDEAVPANAPHNVLGDAHPLPHGTPMPGTSQAQPINPLAALGIDMTQVAQKAAEIVAQQLAQNALASVQQASTTGPAETSANGTNEPVASVMYMNDAAREMVAQPNPEFDARWNEAMAAAQPDYVPPAAPNTTIPTDGPTSDPVLNQRIAQGELTAQSQGLMEDTATREKVAADTGSVAIETLEGNAPTLTPDAVSLQTNVAHVGAQDTGHSQVETNQTLTPGKPVLPVVPVVDTAAPTATKSGPGAQSGGRRRNRP